MADSGDDDVEMDTEDRADEDSPKKRRRDDDDEEEEEDVRFLRPLPQSLDELVRVFAAVDGVLAAAPFRAVTGFEKLVRGAALTGGVVLCEDHLLRITAACPTLLQLHSVGRCGSRSLGVSSCARYRDPHVRQARTAQLRKALLERAPEQTAATRGPKKQQQQQQRASKAKETATLQAKGIEGRVARMAEERTAGEEEHRRAQQAQRAARLPLVAMALRQAYRTEHRTRAAMGDVCERLSTAMRLPKDEIAGLIRAIAETAPEVVRIIPAPPPSSGAATGSGSDTWVEWDRVLTQAAAVALKRLSNNTPD
jgi:hypothetical protein